VSVYDYDPETGAPRGYPAFTNPPAVGSGQGGRVSPGDAASGGRPPDECFECGEAEDVAGPLAACPSCSEPICADCEDRHRCDYLGPV